MKLLLSAALALGFAAPVFAQDVVVEFTPEKFNCADYAALDDASKAALLPLIRQVESVATNTALSGQDDAQLGTTVAAACAEYPTELLVDALSHSK